MSLFRNSHTVDHEQAESPGEKIMQEADLGFGVCFGLVVYVHELDSV